jgi:hypothetical protein
MRDILNLLNLNESVGLANRKPGTVFANPAGETLTFQSLNFYPASGSFQTPNDATQNLDQISKSSGVAPNQIVWTNQAPKSGGGFGLAHFTDPDNKDVYIGRWFKNINPVRIENNFPNELPGGYKLQTKVAQKEAAGYKPTDVLTDLDNQTPESILQQVEAKFGPESDEANATRVFISADSYPIRIPLGKMNFTAFTNYFCEMLQPMALVLGKPTTGSAQKAADKFLTQGGYTTCTITFGSSKIGGLTDSTLVNPAGQVMGLSSKAEGGAKASAKNLIDKIAEIKQDPDGKEFLNKYAEDISLINVITQGSTLGPLQTAVIAGIITPEEGQQIIALKTMPEGTSVDDIKNLTDRLRDKYKGRKARDPKAVIPFYHLRAVIANEVAAWVNENTNFGKVAAEILNWGAFIQVYTYASQTGSDIVLKPFDVVYPSTAVTDVLLSADKTFYSTGSKGNFTFKILYNGATDAETELDDDKVDTKPDPNPETGIIDYEPARSSVTARAGGLDQKKLGTEKTLGRKRQR